MPIQFKVKQRKLQNHNNVFINSESNLDLEQPVQSNSIQSGAQLQDVQQAQVNQFGREQEEQNTQMEIEANTNKFKNEGNDLADQERYIEAIAKWDRALTLTPDDPTLFEMKAQAYMQLEQPFQAVRCATKATELEPLWAESYLTLARAQYNLGEPIMSFENYKKVLDLKQDHQQAQQEMREVAQICGQYLLRDSEGRRADVSLTQQQRRDHQQQYELQQRQLQQQQLENQQNGVINHTRNGFNGNYQNGHTQNTQQQNIQQPNLQQLQAIFQQINQNGDQGQDNSQRQMQSLQQLMQGLSQTRNQLQPQNQQLPNSQQQNNQHDTSQNQALNENSTQLFGEFID